MVLRSIPGTVRLGLNRRNQRIYELTHAFCRFFVASAGVRVNERAADDNAVGERGDLANLLGPAKPKTDGQRFLVNMVGDQPAATPTSPLTVVVNWTAGLGQPR